MIRFVLPMLIVTLSVSPAFGDDAAVRLASIFNGYQQPFLFTEADIVISPNDDVTKKRYDSWSRLSISVRRPLVIFIGDRAQTVPGSLSLSTSVGSFKGLPERCTVIVTPVDGKARWKATLPATATVSDILLAITPRQLDVSASCTCGFGGPCLCGDVCLCTDGDPIKRYAARTEVALASGKPLVAFVGCPVRKVEGCIAASAPAGQFEEHGYPARCIIVGVPARVKVYWRATLTTDASNADILKATVQPTYKAPSEKEVRPQPQVFRQPVFQQSFRGRSGGGGNC